MLIALGAALVLFAVVFRIMAWSGKKKQAALKSHLSSNTLLSIIIPAYRSESTIEKAIISAKTLDYQKKEILVINDSKDRTPLICKKHGVRCIQNSKRLGKPKSMQLGLDATNGEIILFLDSDTVISGNAARRALEWLGNRDVAAVIPRYRTMNKRGIALLSEVENSIMSSLVRMTLFFGTAFGLRGCAFFVKRDVIEKTFVPETLTEDNELSALMLESGKKIVYDDRITARTKEPENSHELARQKFRWGRGSAFVFLRHYRFYLSSPAFLLYFFPHIFIGLLFFPFFVYDAAASFASGNPPSLVFGIIFFMFAQLLHTYILSETPKPPLREAVFYILFYVPFVSLKYFRGICSAARSWRMKEKELDLSYW